MEALDFTTQALALRREIDHADRIAESLFQLGELHLQAGEEDKAHSALDESVGLFRQQDRKPELAEALALLASLPGGNAAEAETVLQEAGAADNTIATRYYLWKATGKTEHLAEAKRLLDYRVEHAPEEYRESMLKNVRLNREIMQAWASLDPELVEGEHGAEAVGEGEAS